MTIRQDRSAIASLTFSASNPSTTITSPTFDLRAASATPRSIGTPLTFVSNLLIPCIRVDLPAAKMISVNTSTHFASVRISLALSYRLFAHSQKLLCLSPLLASANLSVSSLRTESNQLCNAIFRRELFGLPSDLLPQDRRRFLFWVLAF